MKKNYIKQIRSKVGHQKIFLNFVAGAMFDEKGKLLLQKRSDTKKWGLPGGAIELGETFMDALEREFHEETGISIFSQRLLGVYTGSDHTIKYPNGDICQPIVVLYQVAPKSKSIAKRISSETLELSFFAQTDLPSITNKQHKDMIKDCFALNRKNVTGEI